MIDRILLLTILNPFFWMLVILICNVFNLW